MNCREFRRTLMEEAGSDRRHAEGCPDCAAFFERWQAARRLLTQSHSTVPPADFVGRVLTSLPAKRGRRDPLAWAVLRLLPATSALALVLLGWCWRQTPAPAELWSRAVEQDSLTWLLELEPFEGETR